MHQDVLHYFPCNYTLHSSSCAENVFWETGNYSFKPSSLNCLVSSVEQGSLDHAVHQLICGIIYCYLKQSPLYILTLRLVQKLNITTRQIWSEIRHLNTTGPWRRSVEDETAVCCTVTATWMFTIFSELQCPAPAWYVCSFTRIIMELLHLSYRMCFPCILIVVPQ